MAAKQSATGTLPKKIKRFSFYRLLQNTDGTATAEVLLRKIMQAVLFTIKLGISGAKVTRLFALQFRRIISGAHLWASLKTAGLKISCM